MEKDLMDNICGADIAHMHLVCCVLLIFIQNMHVLFHWKIGKGEALVKTFEVPLGSNRKLNKFWVGKGDKSCNWAMKNC